jgi:formylglycine-generating enzyme required for sulfatase activity
MLASASEKQGYYITRSPKEVYVYPFYDENGNMLAMEVMGFRVAQESDAAKDVTPIPTVPLPAVSTPRTPPPSPVIQSTDGAGAGAKTAGQIRKKSSKKQSSKQLRRKAQISKPQVENTQPEKPQIPVGRPVLPKRGNVETDPETGMKFVFVQGGCYQMGGGNEDTPPHEVCLDSFYIGRYEVTQGEWKKVMGANPAKNQAGDDYPVENVSWVDTKNFIEKLNKNSGRNYRLPTEAEWEYAARDRGANANWSGTDDTAKIDTYAWHRENSDDKTHPVGKKKPNKLGIYDMTGNVWEWVEDSFSSDSYAKLNKNNPVLSGEGSGWRAVRRGGSSETKPEKMKNMSRDGHRKSSQSEDHGFRIVLPVSSGGTR